MPTDSTTSPPRASAAQRDERPRPRLPIALLAAVVPAYLFPALTSALSALVIPDPVVAAAVAAASWTTIAIPSAVAAVLVTLWTRRRTPPERPTAGRTAKAVGIAALICVLIAGAGSAVLIGNGVLPLTVLQYTLSSAAIGGGLAARRWARTNRAAHAKRP
ncbi:hypothetical protein ABZ816_34400 [Actinosynnema sp. NPDC047251]|uniref:Putative secreted protein n=1 Tax=Saccharothrix espanaensis (strain ATCC 51144 / DSM 44229 / JCM 9112 / NBRC 15066 / NRRL 15764) TaxID=1179773 RepID=K0K6L7_SACES|nr:hypothetical protein [Saccharothrix espanaensis]CCH32208.1 putative secreted protein [Saccharothrix espanaensis DSM 44229]